MNFSIKFDVLFPWIFLGISIFLIVLVTPFSMLSDKLESFELDTNVYVDFSNETGNNLLVAIEKINQAKSSIDLSFRTPSNFEKSKHFQEFQDSLKNAHDRGIKIRVYTQNQSYTAPSNIETKYFPRTDFKFYVNLMIVDGKDVLIPSSFIPEFTGSDTRINYYVYVNGLGVNAQIFFDYIWNLPKSGSYSVAKRYWAVTRQWTKDKINITLDPTDYFPLNKSSMPSNVKNLITSGSNEKIYFLSERFFPENTESDDLDEMEETAYHTSLLEHIEIDDTLQSVLFTSIDSYCKKTSLYKVIQAIHPNTTQFDTYIERSSNYHLLEGTIIATSQRGMFAPVSYDEIFRSNCLYLGFDFKDSKFFNFFSKFIEKYKNTYFEHLTIRSTICDKYNPDE